MSGSLDQSESFRSLRELGSTEEERADLIKRLADTIDSGWQGQAGTSAYGAATPLRERTLQNAAYLERSQDLLSRQIGSFVTSYQADAQHNIDVFRQYDGAGEYNETNMPQEFHAGGRDGGSVSVKSADTIEVGESSPREGEPGSGAPGEFAGPGNSGGFPGGPSSGHPGSSGGHPGASSGGYPEPSDGETSSAGRQTKPNDYKPVPPSPYPLPDYPSPLPAAGSGGRKVLIESGSEETFGSDVLTTPQVIGDDEYEN